MSDHPSDDIADDHHVQLISARPEVDESFDAAAILRELRMARRRQRLASIDWFDAAYHAYLAGLVGIVLTLFISSAVGDVVLSSAQLASIDAHGPAVLGLVAAVAVAVGLRSGSRGGPLAMEAAEVRYVLLAPVDRAAALKGAALRQIRYATFLGAVVGAIAGELASKRFHTNGIVWVLLGALAGVAVAATAVGTALIGSGRRIPRWAATLAALAIVGWATADLTSQVWSPFRLYGQLGLWAHDFEPGGMVPIVLAFVLLGLGVAAVGGVSLEAAERRTGLVGQLRFAVTVQDLRTVIILRRQLAQDLPRDRPWIRTGKPARRLVVSKRSLRSLLRFPAGRLARIVLLAVIAGLALRGVWQGTSPLIVLGAMALYLAALDVIEPLAQQIDQAEYTERLPVEEGSLHLRFVPVAVITMLIVGTIAWGAAMAAEHRTDALGLGALFIAPASLAALAGAVTSVVMGAPQAPSADGSLIPPEVAGMRIAIRTAWPLLVTVLGSLPIVLAAKALRDGKDPYAMTTTVTGYIAIPVVFTAVWLRFRGPAKLWFRQMMQESQQAQKERLATKSQRGAR